MKLLKIIQKNLKILTRSKASALIIFLGPLLIVSLLGLAFSNTEVYGLQISVHSSSYNEFSNSLLDKLAEQNFQVTRHDSQDTCIASAKQGKSNICIILPADMSLANNEVVFHVDYSKVNIVWMVLDTISEKISLKSKELRESLTTNILQKMVETKDKLAEHKQKADEISNAQSSMVDKTSSVKTSIQGMDISITMEELNMAEIDSMIVDIKEDAESAYDVIEDLIDEVNDSDASESEKESIIDELEDAMDDIEDILDLVSGNESGTLSELIDDVKTKVNDVQSKIASLGTNREEAQTELGILMNLIDDNLNRINELKTSIDAAIANIQGIGTGQADQIVSPIKTTIQPLTAQKTHFNYLFPTLIVLVIMITAILLSSTLVMNEKKSRSFFRNFISPTKDIMFNLGTFLTSLLVIFVQLALFLLIAGIFFGVNIWSSLLVTPVVLLFVIFAFVFLGMLIGYIFKSPETNVLAAISVSALLLFFSSTILPLESIPSALRNLANLSPFVISENLLRQTLFFNFGYADIWVELVILIGYVAVFFGLTVLAQKMLKTKIDFKKFKIKKKK
jgi:ABC-2 type transport system permease protein